MAKTKTVDPSRTITLRRTFAADLKRRFAWLSEEIKKLIIDMDVFGLTGPQPLKILVSQQEWRFLSDPNKIQQFQQWLKQQIDAGILFADADPPWTSEYIFKAYKKGYTRSYKSVNRPSPFQSADYAQGSQAGYVGGAFVQFETTKRLQLLYTRTFMNLQGITQAMDLQLSRILTEGLINGDSSKEIARRMTNTVANITRTRAEVLARTEIIYAHAESQLDSFRAMGIEEVAAMAEWSTAGDALVCPKCEPLEGVVMSIDEARGLIPLHPNCRCIWMPADVGEDKTGQLWGKDRIPALKKSIKAQGKKSTWPGIRRFSRVL